MRTPSFSPVHYPVRQWSAQWPTIIPKRFSLHHLRIRTPCLQTHIHHLFCFMTALQLPNSVPDVTHTPAAYHKPLKHNYSRLSPDSCWKIFQRPADKISDWWAWLSTWWAMPEWGRSKLSIHSLQEARFFYLIKKKKTNCIVNQSMKKSTCNISVQSGH